MAQKKRRQNEPRTPRRSNDPMERLRASQEALRRAQGVYEKALEKRSQAIREASELHTVSEMAETLEISRSKVYEILGRFRAPRRTNAPEEPMLPF
jgi:response regulator of citrate/malate metabolism